MKLNARDENTLNIKDIALCIPLTDLKDLPGIPDPVKNNTLINPIAEKMQETSDSPDGRLDNNRRLAMLF